MVVLITHESTYGEVFFSQKRGFSQQCAAVETIKKDKSAYILSEKTIHLTNLHVHVSAIK